MSGIARVCGSSRISAAAAAAPLIAGEGGGASGVTTGGGGAGGVAAATAAAGRVFNSKTFKKFYEDCDRMCNRTYTADKPAPRYFSETTLAEFKALVASALKSGLDLNAGLAPCSGAVVVPLLFKLADTPPLVQALLEAGADPFVRDSNGDTILHVISDPRVRVIGASPKHPGDKYVIESLYPPEYYFDLIRRLVGMGLDPNTRNALGHTPIMRASPNSPVLLEALMDSGADCKVRIGLGTTLLHTLVKFGNSDEATFRVMEKMIAAGVSIDDEGSTGSTPLYYAVIANNIPMVKWLIEKGAKPRKAEGSGTSYLASYAKKSLAGRENPIPMFEALGATPEEKREFYETVGRLSGFYPV